TIDKAIAAIQKGKVGIALVVDGDRHLVGTITDGDIRRAILNKVSLETTPVSKLLDVRPADYPKPVTALVGTAHEELLVIMSEKVIRQIPLIDHQGRVVELALLSELVEEELSSPISAVVMAGGMGKRLYPLTKDIPKPMLPLQERPLIERTIEQLKKSGIKKVNIATHYKSEVITKHFGNGDNFGVNINYINEDQPLGTAGALGLMEEPKSPVLVVNGDVLTQLDYRAMVDFHHLHKAIMTVGVRKCELEVPYGVIEIDDVVVKDIIEKPVHSFIVNAGIYLIEPTAYNYIPKNSNFDMTDLVDCLVKANHKVICFPIQEYWLDIGHPEHYQKAKEDVKNGKI
ncbi:MAG: nucleotidyltransferase family protein, partial [Candidatus Omnitrophota bacterium]